MGEPWGTIQDLQPWRTVAYFNTANGMQGADRIVWTNFTKEMQLSF